MYNRNYSSPKISIKKNNNQEERVYLISNNDMKDKKILRKNRKKCCNSHYGVRTNISNCTNNRSTFCESTRFMPNSTYTNCFNKPAFEAYGRANTSPVYGGVFYGNYMSTFNSRPYNNNRSYNDYYFLDEDVVNSMWRTNELVKENQRLYGINNGDDSMLDMYHLNKELEDEALYLDLCGLRDRNENDRYINRPIDPYRGKYSGAIGDKFNEKVDRDLYVRLRMKYLDYLKRKREEENKKTIKERGISGNNNIRVNEEKIQKESSVVKQNEISKQINHLGCGCDSCSCENCGLKKKEYEEKYKEFLKEQYEHRCNCKCKICENCDKNTSTRKKILKNYNMIPAGMPSDNNIRWERLNLFKPIENLNME